MSNPFQKIGYFFAAVVHFVISPAGRDKIARALDEAQKLLGPALDAASLIASLTPTRADDEMIALVHTYALGTVTPDMLRNDAVVKAFLKRAAMAELRKMTKTDLPDSVLDLAVQSAYLVYKQAKSDMDVPAPSLALGANAADPAIGGHNQVVVDCDPNDPLAHTHSVNPGS